MRILGELREQKVIEVLREGRGSQPAVMLFSKLMAIVE
jgi:hypothetical protein